MYQFDKMLLLNYDNPLLYLLIGTQTFSFGDANLIQHQTTMIWLNCRDHGTLAEGRRYRTVT